jgi:pyridoxamine 5'-phosphate oxidase
MMMTLATVASDGSPRARSVVCRRIDDDFSLWFVSDARSEKSGQLRAAPVAEAVWWIPDAREQFRFRGVIELFNEPHPSPERDAFWKNLSDESRAMFWWPAPRLPRLTDPKAFPRSLSAEQPPPPMFELLALRAREIEQLDISRSPHDRRLWRAANNWACEEINP